MKRAFRDAWVAELRNPKNKQGAGALRSADGSRCCLGVAADVAGVPYSFETEAVYGAFRARYNFTENNWYASSVPNDFQGLNRFTINTLIQMNDSGQTFPQIADWIESHVPVED